MTFETPSQDQQTVMIPPPAGDRVIDVTNLDFFYGKSQALFGVQLPVARNKITALIGPSGCGKSTLLRCFNRMNDLIPGFKMQYMGQLNDLEIVSPVTSAQTAATISSTSG